MTIKELKYELEYSEKFVKDFAYKSMITEEEKKEINLYRASLVKLLLQVQDANTVPLFTLPSRPGWTSKYD